VAARTFSALRNCWLTPREKVTTFEFASPKPRHTISAITWGCEGEGEGIRSVEGQVQMNQRTWVGDGRGWQGMAGDGRSRAAHRSCQQRAILVQQFCQVFKTSNANPEVA
jgi:hypothetical protein